MNILSAIALISSSSISQIRDVDIADVPKSILQECGSFLERAGYPKLRFDRISTHSSSQAAKKLIWRFVSTANSFYLEYDEAQNAVRSLFNSKQAQIDQGTQSFSLADVDSARQAAFRKKFENAASRLLSGKDLFLFESALFDSKQREEIPVPSAVIKLRRKIDKYWLIDVYDGATCTFSLVSGSLYDYHCSTMVEVLKSVPKVDRADARKTAIMCFEQAAAKFRDSLDAHPEVGKWKAPDRMMLAYAVPQILFGTTAKQGSGSKIAVLVWAARFGSYHMYISAEDGRLLGGSPIGKL